MNSKLNLIFFFFTFQNFLFTAKFTTSKLTTNETKDQTTMSNPLKQVGSRRLPPLASKGGGSGSSNNSPKTTRHKLSKSAGGGNGSGTTTNSNSPSFFKDHNPENRNMWSFDIDIESAFQQGPFRSPLVDLKRCLDVANLPPPSKQNKTNDPTIFLHG